MKKRNYNQVHPNRKRTKKITLDCPRSCEGCGHTSEFEHMKTDSEGVPLCGACWHALNEEVKTWKCTGCGANGPDVVWYADNFCQECDDKTFEPENIGKFKYTAIDGKE